jgi:thiol-disulfide isomerase/thioredoxin
VIHRCCGRHAVRCRAHFARSTVLPASFLINDGAGDAMKNRAPYIARVVVLALMVLGAGGVDASELKPWPGGRTPRLVLKDMQGATHELADYRGKVVLINFWATWCEPCRDEMPAIQRLKNKLAGKPFAVLAVNLAESENKVADYLRRFPVDLTVLLDRNSEAVREWKVRVLPASFLLAPDGSIRYSVIGEFDWTDAKAVEAVTGLTRSR